MGLRTDRLETVTDISYFMNATATRGRAVVYDTSASGAGAAMDDSDAKVKLPAVLNGSGEYLAGLLLNDMVNKDLSQTHLNLHKDEAQIGSKVRLLKRGWVVTDVIHSSFTPAAGLPAYFDATGLLHGTSTASTRVGTWGSKKDTDGYAKLHVDIV